MSSYKKEIRVSELKVGIMITMALAIVFLTIVFAGSIQDILKPKVTIYAEFNDVKGLREGAPVWFSGIEIGSVSAMQFVPKNKIRVSMSIDKETLRYLKQDSHATILTLGLLGDKYIEISPGSRTSKSLAEGDTLVGISQTGFQEIVETSQQSLSRLTEFIYKLQQIIEKLEKGTGTISKFINDPAFYDNLKLTSRQLVDITGKIEKGKGTLGRLVNDQSLYNELDQSVKDIREFAETLKNSEGTIKRLIVDRELYERFLQATTSIEEITRRFKTSRGTVYKLIDDPELYNNINDASKRLNRLLKDLQESQGLWRAMTTDRELVDELKKTLKELNLLIKDIKEHPKKYFKFSIF
ncbi:MAG: MCE family protein [Nitrospirae bacterium]|nr:MCE family protein [Nitrospirota bacterium]